MSTWHLTFQGSGAPVAVVRNETTHPAGWQCDSCDGEEVGGLSAMMCDWEGDGPA